MSLLQTRLRWQQLTRAERAVALKIGVLATFTADPLVPYLGVALEDTGLPTAIFTGPYNQIAQECLNPHSQTAQFQPDMLICWPRLEEFWAGRPSPLVDPVDTYLEDALELAEICLESSRRWQATLVFILPAIPEIRPLGLGEAQNTTGIIATATAVREALRQRLAHQQGVRLLDLEMIVRRLGSSQTYDPRLSTLAHIPFTESFFNEVSLQLSHLIRLHHKPTPRVVVVDGDNTLWGGIVGEDGVGGIDLGPNSPGAAFRDFQRYLLELRRAGLLLALCSKNEEADVRHLLERRDMLLKKEHFSAWRINWQAKPANLREIAEELQLALDSFVFIDDNPAEIAEMGATLPEVTSILMPEDPAHWHQAIAETHLLDRFPPTAEDLQRASQYEQEQQRRANRREAPSPEAYLADLDIEVRIFPPDEADMPRLAQLVAKTNQFNLNGQRRSEMELQQMKSEPGTLIRLVQAQDRFGDYGTIGAYVLRRKEAGTYIDTFLLSCRVMGRGIEQAMIADIFANHVRDNGPVLATPVSQPRNEPARRFFAQLGCNQPDTPAAVHALPWPDYIRQQIDTHD